MPRWESRGMARCSRPRWAFMSSTATSSAVCWTTRSPISANTLSQTPSRTCACSDRKGDGEMFPASMGIYVFNRDIIRRLLDNTFTDFGKPIIPNAIKDLRVFSFMFQGYWEDIGTIRAFFDANLDVTNELPRFNFFDMAAPIFSRPRFLPGSKINGAQIDHAVISDGCIINRAVITHSIVGLRTIVGSGAVLNRVIVPDKKLAGKP